LLVVGEPEDLREELGQAQAGAKLGNEARRLIGFDVEGVGRVGRDEERLADAHASAGAADATDDLALEDLEALFLEAVAVQRFGAAAGLDDRLGSQHFAGGGHLDVHHAADAERVGGERVELLEEDLSGTTITATLSELGSDLRAYVRELVGPLFVLFDFFDPSPEVVCDIVENYVAGRVT
jgi:hypothetical protein